MKPSWIQSFSSMRVTPLELQIEQVVFADIPHALSQKVRFNGHLIVMGYSVAQHCVMGAEELAKESKNLGLAFLLHEVSEVYLPDVPSPIKHRLRIETEGSKMMTWEQLEDQHADVIVACALGMPVVRSLIDHVEVKTADRRMLLTEKRDLMEAWSKMHADKALETWGPQAVGYEPYAWKIDRAWPAAEAKERFIDAFYRFTR